MVIFIAAPELLRIIATPIVLTIIISGLAALGMSKLNKITDSYPPPNNPLSLPAALKLALFFAGMLLVVTVAQRTFGYLGMQIVVFLGSLFELHGVALGIATLSHQGSITPVSAMYNIGLAVLGSFVSKLVIVWVFGRGRFILFASLALFLMATLFSGLLYATIVLMH
jgi:uncharacterized membrane protein (DUF4010 family)